MQYFNAFWVGGLICVMAQILIDKTKLTPARILVTFELVGFALGVLGIYEKITEYAGCGASVPISGFGNLLASAVREAVRSDGIVGVLSGGVEGAAAGIGAVIFFAFLMAVLFKPRDKS